MCAGLRVNIHVIAMKQLLGKIRSVITGLKLKWEFFISRAARYSTATGERCINESGQRAGGRNSSKIQTPLMCFISVSSKCTFHKFTCERQNALKQIAGISIHSHRIYYVPRCCLSNAMLSLMCSCFIKAQLNGTLLWHFRKATLKNNVIESYINIKRSGLYHRSLESKGIAKVHIQYIDFKPVCFRFVFYLSKALGMTCAE